MLRENARLQQEVAGLKRQLQWYQKQVFGSKTEKRLLDPPEQTHFHDILGEPPAKEPVAEKQTVTYERGNANKKRSEDDLNNSGLPRSMINSTGNFDT